MTAKCVVEASSFLKACAENTVTAFQKKNAFWSNFLLKTFLNDCKVFDATTPRPGPRTVLTCLHDQLFYKNQ